MRLLCIDNTKAEDHLKINKIYNGKYISNYYGRAGYNIIGSELTHGIPFYTWRFKEIKPIINKNIKIL